MVSTTNNREVLPFLSSQDRLSAYQLIIDGCSHIYSKNKLQQEKALQVLNTLIPLTKTDPYFLAHLTSYVINKSQSKDLKTFLTYVASLSSADGSPFSVGSKYNKPNLRYIAAAALHKLEPKLVERVLELAMLEYAVANHLNKATHFPQNLQTAIKKYLTYRENNLEIVGGIKKSGLAGVYKNLYRIMHRSPTDEVAKILRWRQKDRKIEMDNTLFDFKGKTDLEIAEKIRKERLPILGVLGALPRQMSPVIAVALLEQATGNQAVILRKTFEDAGVLKDKEVMKLYEEKILGAKTALDRVENLSATASEEVKRVMKKAKAHVRQYETMGIGKVYIHLDDSGSMQDIREFAIDHGAIFAECVNNPEANFAWGMFGSRGQKLPLPQEFVKDAFASVLFGYRDGGGTYCFALYPTAREFGADVDVFVSDQENTFGDLGEQIKEFHASHPKIKKPRACVVVNFGHYGRYKGPIQEAYEQNDIPVAVLKPETLKESALVVSAIKNALLGPVQVIDEIMNTELLRLPNYYFSL